MAAEVTPEGLVSDNGTKDITPTYANYVHGWIQGGMVRLTYGEVTGGKTNRFHTAVVLTAADAQRFAHLVLDLIQSNPQSVTVPAPTITPKPPGQSA